MYALFLGLENFFKSFVKKIIDASKVTEAQFVAKSLKHCPCMHYF